MTKLTKEEILEQLQKIGVKASSDLDFYLHDYKEYYRRNIYLQPERNYHERTDSKPPLPFTLARRLSRKCYSLFPVLVNSLPFSRVKAQKFIKK